MPPGEGEFMGCGFVAKLPTFSQALLDWTKILAFFFFSCTCVFLMDIDFLFCFGFYLFVCLFVLVK